MIFIKKTKMTSRKTREKTGETNMIDPDTILTKEEKRLLKESYMHQKEGKLIPLEEVKRELGLLDEDAQ